MRAVKNEVHRVKEGKATLGRTSGGYRITLEFGKENY
jgi:hypothetical protein